MREIEGDQAAVQAQARSRPGEGGAEALGLDRARRREHALEIAVPLEPLDGGLWPDPVQPGDVVRCVTDECEVIDDTLRPDAEFLPHPRRVEQAPAEARLGTGRGQEHADTFVDELSEVFVGTDDQYVIASGRAPRRTGGEQVIALDALNLDRRQAEQAGERLHPIDLARQVLGHLRPLGLVFGVEFEPFAGTAEIEKHRRMGGFLLIDQPPERFHPAVEGVGGKPVRTGERRSSVETTVGQVIAVDKEPARHGDRELSSKKVPAVAGGRDGDFV